ncbi:uncharacterized protein [Clytia hemisphaerica]|eukprot:TCONS_00021293-protein
MVHHNKNRKDKFQKLAEKNGLTSSINSNASFASDSNRGQNNSRIDNEYDRPLSKSSMISNNSKHGSSNHRVKFANDRTNDRANEVSNSRIQRIRGSFHKRKPNSTKVLLLRRNREIGFGFSIRGGVEHGTGIFISNINKYSDAQAQGLQIGDQILRANNALFEGIVHDEAVGYIQRQKILQLIVLSLGVIPGNKIALTEYQWMDCYGQPCSPMTSRAEERINESQLKSINPSRHLLSAEDERKINIDVGNSATLGLLIRGGSEYGLGIFVVGIDQDSVADQCGIMVGEQILEINGIDFVNITHADAAEIIRTSRRMTMVLKDVGKIPLSRVVYDRQEWIRKKQIMQREQQIRERKKDLIIQEGLPGRLSSHQSLASPVSFQWVEEKARGLLNQDEWATLKYYIREYARQNLTVNELGLSLLDLFDSDEKMTLIDEIRGIVPPQDIEHFDELMLSMEVASMTKNRSNRQSYRADVSLRGRFHGNDEEYDEEYGDQNLANRKGSRVEFGYQPNPSNTFVGDTTDFNYGVLNEDTYQSVFDEITDETDLSTTQSTKHRTLLDDAMNGFDKLETVDENEDEMEDEEPLYAKVVKPRLTEYENNRSPQQELKTFQSPQNERHIYQSPPKDRKPLKSPAIMRRWHDDEEENEEENQNGGEEAGIDNLGFAFSFLGSQENSKENSPKISQREDIYSSPHLSNYSPKTSQRESERSINSRGGMGNNTSPLVSNGVSRENSFHSYQPKSFGMYQQEPLGRFNSYEEKNEKREQEDKSEYKIVGSFEEASYSNKKSGSSPTVDEPPEFNLTKSLDKHYSNFSVNDIVRQNFLPTTRVYGESSEQENEIKSIINTRNNSTNIGESGSGNRLSLTRLSSLNIQNQYQYQETSRSLSPTPEKTDFLGSSQTSNILSSETYGKPVVSPRPPIENNSTPSENTNFTPSPLPPPPPSLLENTPDNTIERLGKIFNSTTTKYTRPTRLFPNGTNNPITEPEINYYSMDRLKKTERGDALLGRGNASIENLNNIDPQLESPVIEYRASKLLGTMSLSIEKLDENDNPIITSPPRRTSQNDRNPIDFAFQSHENRSPRFDVSPRNALSSYNTEDINIVRGSHQIVEGETNVSTLRRRIDQSIHLQNTSAVKPKQHSAIVTENQKTLPKWVKQTDFRPKVTNPKYKDVASPREASNQLKSRIDVFSKPKHDPQASIENFRKIKRGNDGLPRTVSIPNMRDDDPGFSVNVRTNQNGEQEIYVAKITKNTLHQIEVDDVIIVVGDHKFKAGVKQGLANLIIKNKFSSTEDSEVTLTIK